MRTVTFPISPERALCASLVGLAATLPLISIGLVNVGTGVQPSFVFAMVCFALAVLLWAKGRMTPMFGPPERLAAVFLALSVLSVIVSLTAPVRSFEGEAMPWRSLKQLMMLAFMIISYLTVVSIIQNRSTLQLVVCTLLLSSFIVSLYGLYQFVGAPRHWPWVTFPLTNSGFQLRSGWVFAEGIWLRLWRVSSTTPEPLFLGSFLLLSIPISLSLLALRQSRSVYFFLVIAAEVSMATLLLTFSKGAIAGFVATLATLVAVRGITARRGLTLLLFLAGFVSIIIWIGVGRLPWQTILTVDRHESGLSTADTLVYLSKQAAGTPRDVVTQLVRPESVRPEPSREEGLVYKGDASVLERIAMWETALHMFRAHPITGVGTGNFVFYSSDHWPDWARGKFGAYSTSYNYYLQVLSEMGILGITAFLGFLGSLLVPLVSIVRDTRDPFMTALSRGVLASLVGIFVQLLTWAPTSILHLWFAFALAGSLRAVHVNADSPAKP